MSSPPHYVLLSHSSLSSSSSATLNTPPTLAHPTIQYQYRDDPPLSISNPQHVLVMDYNPGSTDMIHVQSLSPQIAVTSLKVTEAPGTGSIHEDDAPKNTKMYVLETVAHPLKTVEKNAGEDMPPVVSLTTFKQRNTLLRKALEYPLPSAALSPITAAAPSAPAVSPRPSPSRPVVSLPPNSPTC